MFQQLYVSVLFELSQEPHPADDLNGADVARKLTILSRMIPSLVDLLPEGYKSVDTKSLVPSELEGIASGDEFCAQLPAHDQGYQALRDQALQEKKVLRYVGVIDVKAKTIRASLERSVLRVHPPMPYMLSSALLVDILLITRSRPLWEGRITS